MESMLWGLTTAEQAMALEDAAKNPFLPGNLHSADYFADLKRRREQYPMCSPEKRQEFLERFHSREKVTIVVGDAGCGKTTQLVQFILFDEWMHSKIVGCTQPRGSAASSAAAQVASEMELPLGGIVGCQTHTDDSDRSGEDTRLKFLTDSFLLQELMRDPGLDEYGCIVVDQAHERTLATDMMMALLKHAARAREDLRVVIVSDVNASLDKFTKFFDTSNVFRAAERANAIQIRYLQEETPEALATACSLIRMIARSKPKGNILLFLTSDREVRGACERLGRDVPTLQAIPLCQAPSSLEALQDSGAQKCFITTSLAEVSVKIPEITYVIDKGRCRQVRYNPRVGMYILMTVPIPKPAAQLRAAQVSRRQQGGICYRLYSKHTFDRICPPNNHLAIHASEMTREVLVLKCCGYHKISEFNFVDRPHAETMLRALAELRALGYIDGDTNLTQNGATAACMPVPIHPAWYNAFLEAKVLGCMSEIVTIACLLSSQEDLFVRPYEQRYNVDVKRQYFSHPDSDHLARLNAFLAYLRRRDIFSDEEELANWCQSRAISLEVAEEARLMRDGLMTKVSQHMLDGGPVLTLDPRDPEFSAKVRQCLAAGFCHKTAILSSKGDGIYKTVHENYPVALEPDSCLIGMSWEWVIYHRIRYAGIQYMHCITAIDPEWIMKRQHFQDHNLARKYDQVTLRNPDVKASLDRARAKANLESA
ncbi:Helicase ATP-binding domain-containing protein [Fusarium keratoplasticum]|nr:Helicase ATP-binding domain-containing protein [Fusarium keratoplasticum]